MRMSDEHIPKISKNKLTPNEVLEKRFGMLHDVDDYITEMIQYCDDKQDLIALGSVLLVMSKNILTSVVNKKEWADSLKQYTVDVMEEPEVTPKRWSYKSVDEYKGKYF
jgi:hypothetical protein